MTMERQCDYRSDPHLFTGLGNPLAVNPYIAGFDQPLCQGAALHQPNEEEIAVKAHLLPFETRKHGEGVFGARRLGSAAARPAVPAPGPGLARRHEAHFSHQVLDRRFVESEADDECAIDRIFAAMLANMMGMGGETIGKVDPQPVGPKAAEGKCRAPWIGATVECSRRRCGKPRHRLT